MNWSPAMFSEFPKQFLQSCGEAERANVEIGNCGNGELGQWGTEVVGNSGDDEMRQCGNGEIILKWENVELCK